MEDWYHVDNGAGWKLGLKRVRPETPRRCRPVLIVPGYGMNSFIFGFHPRGLSLERYLASHGLEVWSVDLRGQGRTVREGGGDSYGMAELAVDDLGAAVGRILELTSTGRDRVDLIGCSLGAALSFAHVACVPDAPIGSIVSMGGVVTWKRTHPAVRVAFFSPRLAGLVRVKNTRRIAGALLPMLAKWAPSLLSGYLNASSSDLSQAQTLSRTVEDPHPIINREIAEWIGRGDLIIREVNVSLALARMKMPFLCVVAMSDGIVMPETSRATYFAIGSKEKELLEIGTAEAPIAHGDLFVSTGAQEKIFQPIAEFLLRQE